MHRVIKISIILRFVSFTNESLFPDWFITKKKRNWTTRAKRLYKRIVARLIRSILNSTRFVIRKRNICTELVLIGDNARGVINSGGPNKIILIGWQAYTNSMKRGSHVKYRDKNYRATVKRRFSPYIKINFHALIYRSSNHFASANDLLLKNKFASVLRFNYRIRSMKSNNFFGIIYFQCTDKSLTYLYILRLLSFDASNQTTGVWRKKKKREGDSIRFIKRLKRRRKMECLWEIIRATGSSDLHLLLCNALTYSFLLWIF